MRNRSISSLPVYYATGITSDLSPVRREAGPLEVFDITHLHFHDYVEVGLCTEGRGTCIVEEREYPFTAGDVEIIFPYQKHLSRSEGGKCSRWLWDNLDPARLAESLGPQARQRVEKLKNRMGLCGIIDRAQYPLITSLITEVVLPGERAKRVACLYALIEELAAASETLPNLQMKPGARFLRLEPALDRIREELENGQCPEVEELAGLCAMSPATFRRLFREEMGRSPKDYLALCRMTRARKLLIEGDLSVTDIAQRVGYQDVSGFNRLFLQAFGMAPREYRKRIEEGDVTLN